MELNKCKIVEFEDIEIGEVFGAEGCFVVLVKESNDSARVLACDSLTSYFGGDITGKVVKMTPLAKYISRGIFDRTDVFKLNPTKTHILSSADESNIISWEGLIRYYRLPKNYQRYWKHFI